jgi:hypothetical protein
MIVCVAAQVVHAQRSEPGSIRWRSGAVAPSAMAPTQVEAALRAVSDAGQRHLVVQFNGPVDAAVKAELRGAGLTLLNYLDHGAFFASITTDAPDFARIANSRSLVVVNPIERRWRLHPYLLAGQVPQWAGVNPEQTGKDVEPIVGAYVLFHPDVALVPTGVDVVRRHGANVRSHLESVNGLVIELPFSKVTSLADEDAVQWVEPPLPRMAEKNDSNRIITEVDTVQGPPYGLDGSGVTVLVYDAAYALASHADFGGRLTVRDSSGLGDHATHVSGTVGGSGAASGGQYRGMAPAVSIESYGYEYDGSGIFLYTNPGDIEDDYDEAINVYGADISNNSIGTNTCWNGFPCSITGDYGVTAVLIDSIVGGSLGEPMRIVWANGNERSCTSCPGEHQNGYHSTAPPACAKNHLTVGALNSNNDTQTNFSSWGPCDDGRLKPDLAGPGCQSNGDFDVTSCSSSGGYTGKCGTSMASPTVCGIGALLLEDFRNQYPGEPDFRNSTLRAMLGHTAQDLGNAGPDYSYGYGSVRAQAAVDFLRTGNFIEENVGQGEVYSVLVVVAPGDPELKVTMAWDDAPGVPNVDPALVNDLDLVVYDPLSTQHFPWTLNPASPSSPAVRTQADHVNNIEQVYVASPAPGAWRVEVHGFNVPSGPQPFSICASPLLVNCSIQGVITLDRAKYTCQSEATIQVVDCDLNTDDGLIETVSITVTSYTEPGGEAVLLTETSAETAAFRGTLPLDTTDAAGVLHISSGDTVTATYIDADDGMGGVNVTVDATAVVDCQGPVIANVQNAEVGPFDATITFDTDEPALGTVMFGTSCGSLTQEALGTSYETAHSIEVTGLQEASTYYYAIAAEDEAGNAGSNDNGGECFIVITPDIPNYFTEQFTGTNDLELKSMLFTVDGSFEYYVGCIESITELPTDPSGGTSLTFSDFDDGSTSVSLSGGATVSIYGTSYSSFYIGTNGFITFGSGDTDYEESLADHFSQPRVSGWFDDLNLETGGSLTWKQLADRATITWQDIPEYGASNSNTFQIELYFNGDIRISYLDMDAGDGIAGLSAGEGVPDGFFESDLTSLFVCAERPPTAFGVLLDLPPDTPALITLPASDDGLPDPPGMLTYTVLSLPEFATLNHPGTGPIETVPFELPNGDNQVEYVPLPWFTGGTTFEFKANDGGIPPDGGDSNVAIVSITVGGPGLVYAFPLDADPGWTREGQWEFGVPLGGGSNNGDPTSGFTGTNVFGYNLAGDYPDDLPPTHLTTTAIDCSDVLGTELRFYRWLGVEGATYDHASVSVSSDGTNFTTVWDHEGASTSDSSWSQWLFDISEVADGQANVYIRWTMGPTDDFINYPGWNIDDVEIWGVTSPADCNANGVPDFQDIIDGTSEDCNENSVPDECESEPAITSQPESAEACSGGAVTFSVTAAGYGELAYQWRKDTVDIPGATQSSLTIDPVSIGEVGSYDVVITSDCGSTTSDAAALSMSPQPPGAGPDPIAPDAGSGTKNRYLSFRAGEPGRVQAAQVTFASLPGHAYAEGRAMWVQEPYPITESSGSDGPDPEPAHMAAELGCLPYYTDWSALGVVDVYDDGIVPGGTYEVRVIDELCDTGHAGSYSVPLSVDMTALGDVAGDCADCPCTAPDGVIDFVDISAVVEKFKNTVCEPGGPGVPRKARADLTNSEPTLAKPDHKIDFVDISYCVDAFRGEPTLPPGPPATDPCE